MTSMTPGFAAFADDEVGAEAGEEVEGDLCRDVAAFAPKFFGCLLGDVSFDEIGVNLYDGAGAVPFFVCPLRGVGVSKYADLDGNVFAVLFFYLVEGHVGRGNLVELIFRQFNFRGSGPDCAGLKLGHIR